MLDGIILSKYSTTKVVNASHGGGSLRNSTQTTNNGSNPNSLVASASSVNDEKRINRFYPTEFNWESGTEPINVFNGVLPTTLGVSTKTVVPSAMGKPDKESYEKTSNRATTGEEFKRMRMSNSVAQDMGIVVSKHTNIWGDDEKRNELLNENKTLIQNSHSFPYYIKSSSGTTPAKYDYQIIPGDPRYPTMVTLEDKLKEARAAFGIQVHGNNDIARAVTYNLYNRFKTPNPSFSFNKMTTHVLFSRPDLNLLDCSGAIIYGANKQIKNHSDTSLLYKTNPYLFRLLTSADRCGDRDNFNMLLSNQIASFDISDEELNTTEVGKTWAGNSMFYGNEYSGKSAGEFTCTFTETPDLSIIKIMKLWITYIDNVSKGAWSPSYDLHGYGAANLENDNYIGTNIGESYVYTKTIDYAASVYVFKCGPDGSDVLYWTKYFGVFPINTGASALSWTSTDSIGELSKINIKFKYCYKRDLSPISLVEFNRLSGINTLNRSAEASFNPSYGHTSRPWVGAPFIELAIPNDGDEIRSLGRNSDMFGKPRTHIRLKCLENSDEKLTDELLYKSPYGVKTVQNSNNEGSEILLC